MTAPILLEKIFVITFLKSNLSHSPMPCHNPHRVREPATDRASEEPTKMVCRVRQTLADLSPADRTGPFLYSYTCRRKTICNPFIHSLLAPCLLARTHARIRNGPASDQPVVRLLSAFVSARVGTRATCAFLERANCCGRTRGTMSFCLSICRFRSVIGRS
ncbi:hypothetical protein BKA81DRAFT_139238 [Phyllosticta paracitricarpa]